jgi:hypothetical protein
MEGRGPRSRPSLREHRRRDDERRDELPVVPDDHDLVHPAGGGELVLDGLRGDVLPRVEHEQLLHPVDEAEVAVLVDRDDVARPE